MNGLSIRRAAIADARAVRDIYAPIVARTTISFESEPPDAETMASRITAAEARHAWLVAERDGHLAGYAYGGPYRALFDALAARGYFHAYAGITQPNEPSARLHAAAGFTRIGRFPSVGYKFGAWHDVDWWYRPLRDGHPDGDPR